MNKWTTLLIAIFLFQSLKAEKTRSILTLEKGWRFINMDVKNAQLKNNCDSNWQEVIIPHDWAISGNFNLNIDVQYVQVKADGETKARLRTGRTGALPMFGVGWYRKILPISLEDKDKKISIEFDGAMSLAKIYLNGIYIGEQPYGYSSFSFDLTNFIQFGKENILAVRLENKTESSRWYTGAGIYRNVRLVKTMPTHVAHWGTFVTTPKLNVKSATVNIKTEIIGNETETGMVKLVTEIYTKTGEKVSSVVTSQKITSKLLFDQNLQIKTPILWSIESPKLYNAVSKVYVNDILTDEYSTTFGCRSIRFDKDKGFFLNEKQVKIKGVCLHHDLGPMGAAVNYRATERQVEILKEMGAMPFGHLTIHHRRSYCKYATVLECW